MRKNNEDNTSVIFTKWNDEEVINRMHELIYDRCYNQKAIFKIIKADYGIAAVQCQKLFKKLAQKMKQNTSDLLDAAGEKVLTVLFELLDDQNAVVRLKAIEMIMRFMQINIENLNTIGMKIENISYKIIPQKDE